jgi:hypothetical protein
MVKAENRERSDIDLIPETATIPGAWLLPAMRHRVDRLSMLALNARAIQSLKI